MSHLLLLGQASGNARPGSLSAFGRGILRHYAAHTVLADPLPFHHSLYTFQNPGLADFCVISRVYSCT